MCLELESTTFTIVTLNLSWKSRGSSTTQFYWYFADHVSPSPPRLLVFDSQGERGLGSWELGVYMCVPLSTSG